MRAGRPKTGEDRAKRCPILIGLYKDDIERLDRIGNRLNTDSKSETVREVLKNADKA